MRKLFDKEYRISLGYGIVDALHYIPHEGVDFATPVGTLIYAPEKAVVTKLSIDNAGALILNLEFVRDRKEGIYYAHLSKFNCKQGDIVEPSKIIGYSGNTGISSGPHTHVSWYYGGKVLDPMPYLNAGQLKPSNNSNKEEAMYKEKYEKLQVEHNLQTQDLSNKNDYVDAAVKALGIEKSSLSKPEDLYLAISSIKIDNSTLKGQVNDLTTQVETLTKRVNNQATEIARLKEQKVTKTAIDTESALVKLLKGLFK